MALVQHTAAKVCDCAIISFCAVVGSIINRHDQTVTYTSENQMARVLSKLTYICQLLVLQKAHLLVEKFLVQFFKLVQPLRLLMSRDASIPSQISDYIWSDGKKPWPETRITRFSRV